MTDRRRHRLRGRGVDGPLLRAATLSAVLHALAIVLVLLAPHRLPSAPLTAYTVEVVDPGALGGKLLAGPIGGDAAARRSADARRKPPAPPDESAAGPAEPPAVVAKAAPPAPAPKPAEDLDAIPLGRSPATPQASKRAAATPKPKATAAAAAKAKPSPTSVAVAKRPAPSPASKREAAKPAGRKDERPAAGDLESRLAAAIKGVEEKVGRTGHAAAGGTGPSGGHGGTEQTLDRPPGIGGEGPGGGGIVRGLDFVLYYNAMLNRIKESWTWVGGRSDLQVTVRFRILDSGEIDNLSLVERSGDPGYDASVVRAVKQASPLGSPPAAYRKDFEDVELTFRPGDLRRPPGE